MSKHFLMIFTYIFLRLTVYASGEVFFEKWLTGSEIASFANIPVRSFHVEGDALYFNSGNVPNEIGFWFPIIPPNTLISYQQVTILSTVSIDRLSTQPPYDDRDNSILVGNILGRLIGGMVTDDNREGDSLTHVNAVSGYDNTSTISSISYKEIMTLPGFHITWGIKTEIADTTKITLYLGESTATYIFPFSLDLRLGLNIYLHIEDRHEQLRFLSLYTRGEVTFMVPEQSTLLMIGIPIFMIFTLFVRKNIRF